MSDRNFALLHMEFFFFLIKKKIKPSPRFKMVGALVLRCVCKLYRKNKVHSNSLRETGSGFFFIGKRGVSHLEFGRSKALHI